MLIYIYFAILSSGVLHAYMFKAARGSDELIAKFEDYCRLAGSSRYHFTVRASRKLTEDVWQSKYGKYDIKEIIDASVFPHYKDKGQTYMTVNKANVDRYITTIAKEVGMRKTNNTNITVNDDEVQEIKEDLIKRIIDGAPKVNKVKYPTDKVFVSIDASTYSGATGNRTAGRPSIAGFNGYIGYYRGMGTGETRGNRNVSVNFKLAN